MLSKVLSKETCAKCRFCCSFRRCSLWETPLFPKNECEKLSKDNEYGVKSDFQMQGEYGQMKLLHKYCTQDSEVGSLPEKPQKLRRQAPRNPLERRCMMVI